MSAFPVPITRQLSSDSFSLKERPPLLGSGARCGSRTRSCGLRNRRSSARAPRAWSARQESNLQHPVCRTGALPIELRAGGGLAGSRTRITRVAAARVPFATRPYVGQELNLRGPRASGLQPAPAPYGTTDVSWDTGAPGRTRTCTRAALDRVPLHWATRAWWDRRDSNPRAAG